MRIFVTIIIFLLSFNLQAQKSCIRIISSPGTSVYLDTTLIGETSPGKGEIKIADLVPGKYWVTLKNGKATLTEAIEITDKNPRILYADPATGKTEDRSPVNRNSKYALLEYENPHVEYGEFTDPRNKKPTKPL